MKIYTARELLDQALKTLLNRYPLFAEIILGWEIVSDPDCQTMATNGPQLFFNPEYIDQGTGLSPAGPLTMDEIIFTALHETFHNWLGHHLRLFDADPDKRNIAFDLALNYLIRNECPSQRLRRCMLFPGSGPYADFPDDKSAEFYMAKLDPEKPQEPDPSQDSQPDKDSQDQGGENESQNQPGNQDSDQPGDQPGDSSQESQGQGQPSPGQGQGSPGNGPGSPGTPGQGQQGQESGPGQAQDSQQGQNSQPGTAKGKSQPRACKGPIKGLGEVLPCPNCDTPEQKAAAEAKWQSVVAESLALGDMCGNLPGWIKSVGEKLLGQSKVDWRMILRRFMNKTVPSGNTYSYPSRRHSWRKDVIMPAHRSKGGSDGVIIADVSGSIFARVNESVMPEIEKILGSIRRSSITLIPCDTRVVGQRKFVASDFPLRLPYEWKGGGGTDLNPAFEQVRKQRGKFKYCICITDFYWGYQQAPNPGIPTLWIAVGRDGWQPSKEEKPRFGELVNSKHD